MNFYTNKQRQWKQAEQYVWEKTRTVERELVESIREQGRIEVLRKLHRISGEFRSGLPENLKKRERRGEWKE